MCRGKARTDGRGRRNVFHRQPKGAAKLLAVSVAASGAAIRLHEVADVSGRQLAAQPLNRAGVPR